MRHSIATAGVALLVLLTATPSNPSAEADAVNRAIDRGVTALKQILNGTIKGGGVGNSSVRGAARMRAEMQVGVTGLAVLTLLECGVAPDDPGIQKQLPLLRQNSVAVNHTYSIAVLIALFDRLNDVDDVPLIHSLALRLLAGQYYASGWSYYCPPTPPEEVQRLTKLIKERPAVPRERKKGDAPKPPLPEEVQAQLKRLAALRRDTGRIRPTSRAAATIRTRNSASSASGSRGGTASRSARHWPRSRRASARARTSTAAGATCRRRARSMATPPRPRR